MFNKKEYQRQYWKKNRAKLAADNRRWQKEHPEKLLEYYRKYRAKNKKKRHDYMRGYHFQKRHDNVGFNLLNVLRARIARCIKTKGMIKSQSTASLLGCSLPDFIIYLETLFQPSMTWENHGTVWHVDHIMPCAIFDLSKPEHQKRCFHFSNMQPLFAADNLRKSDKVKTGANSL